MLILFFDGIAVFNRILKLDKMGDEPEITEMINTKRRKNWP